MVCILSYCDTKEKKTQLSDLIGKLKLMYSNQKILVYSHYQNIEPEYYTKADYYIFDYSNPESTRHIIDWLIVRPHHKKFHRIGSDWGLAVLQMIKRSSLFIKSISNEGCFFLNYDINHNLIQNYDYIKKSKELSSEQIGIFSHWGTSTISFSLTGFYLDLPKISSSFFENITSQKYHGYPIQLIPEDIFKKIVDEQFENRYIMSEKIPTTISGSSRSLPKDHPLREFFSTICPTRNNFPNDLRKCITLWDCKNFIEDIEIQFNNKSYIITNEISGEDKNTAFFAHLPKDFKSNNILLTKINSVEIETPYLMDGLDDIYWKKNYHDEV